MNTPTWEIVDDADGIDVRISAEGRSALADEQERDREAQVSVEIRIWCVAGAVVAIAWLAFKQLKGM